MQPEEDIFIYYDNADNSHFEGQEYGWVDNFERFLKMMLRQVLGKEPSFLHLSQEKTPSKTQLGNVKILILLVSPQALKSPKLINTYNSFLESRSSKEKEEIPVYKVIKYPVGDQPEALNRLLSYDLFDFNLSTGTIREFDNFFSSEAEINYWMKMVDLAYDIHEQLVRYETIIKTQKEDTRKSIFLAETGPELVVQRNMIKRELQRQGYTIYPKINLPEDSEELKKQIISLLNQCFVSIHLFGDRIAQNESGSGNSQITEQNDIVSHYIEENDGDDLKNFSRLIWLSPNFKVSDENDQGLIEKLRREVEDTGRTEIFQTPFEDFKFILKKTLSEIPDRNTIDIQESDNSGGKKKIYVIYDKSDSLQAVQLENVISNKGYDILRPSFEGDLMDIRRLHIQNLVDFDGVIIYSNDVNDFWVKMKLLDILKSPGFGRLKPLNNKAIVSSGGDKFNKEVFKNFEIDLIESEQIDNKVMEPFLAKIN